MPVFSVIIPTFNRATFVTKAIDSVLQQTVSSYEVIVVDDGSTDSTAEVLTAYKDKITLLKQANRGVGAARNRGLESAIGEWVAFLDSDDEWKPQYLASQLEVIRAHPDIICAVTNAASIDKNGVAHLHFRDSVLGLFRTSSVITLSRPFATVISHPHWYVQSLVARRDTLFRSGLFNVALSIGEDLDVIARLSLEGSFAFNRNILVEIHRRFERISSLASRREQDGLSASHQFQVVLDNLARDSRLTTSERRELARMRSANERWQGNLLLIAGKVSDAREHYRRGLTIRPSIRSIGRYSLSFLPHRSRP
jgi:glycosyltransferase involved in cell wall biosynthesis